MKLSLALISVLVAAAPALSGAWEMPDATGARYICKGTGDNKNPGTKEQPFKEIDAALKKAKGGETYFICEGVYLGTFDIGYVETDKAVKLYGGFSADFSARDPLKHRTLFQPSNASAAKARAYAMLTFKNDVDGIVIDGMIFDGGFRNSYDPKGGKPQGVETGMLLLPPAKAPGENATVEKPCLYINGKGRGGTVAIRNSAFLNCANYAIQGGLHSGKYTISNNLFIATRMAAIELSGTCPTKGVGPSAKETTSCGQLEIDHNTFLFTWSRLKDFADMGYAIRIMSQVSHNIHDNIIGASIQGGLDHARFNKNELRLDHNGFFVNRAADIDYSPASNTRLRLMAEQFGDLEFTSVKDNTTQMPKGFPIDKAYLEGFLAARYTEEADYDPDSPANAFREAMGLNKQGKLKTAVSMFANRYPVDRALQLFGAMPDMGAQIAK